MKNLFIFGAGASKLAGAPLMNDFFDRAEGLLNGGRLSKEKAHFERVFAAISDLQGVHAKAYLDLENLESVFGAIETAIFLGRLGNRSIEEIKELRRSLIILIYTTLERQIHFPVSGKSVGAARPFDEFISMLKDIRKRLSRGERPIEYSFVTFNYDLCLEQALLTLGMGYSYCVDGALSKVPPVLKLHGSINWVLKADGSIGCWDLDEVEFNLFDSEIKSVTYDLGSRLSDRECGRKKLKGDPLIVPPTWNKGAYSSGLANVWGLAASELGAAENIFVIGYSLPETDAFFRYLFALGSQSSVRLKNLVILNPDKSGETEKRFRNLIGRGIESRFQYLSKGFSEGVVEIARILEEAAR